MRDKKFYNKNEKKVMRKLGFNPQEASGSGWVKKEDGENNVALAQLKSTDCESFKLSLVDIDKLVYHANVSNKMPIFILEFIGKTTMVMIRPEDLDEFVRYMVKGEFKEKEEIKIELKKGKKERLKFSERRVEIEEEKDKEEITLEGMYEKRRERKGKQEKRRIQSRNWEEV